MADGRESADWSVNVSYTLLLTGIRPMTTRRTESLAGRFYWVPLLLIAGLLAVDQVKGPVFHPTPGKKPRPPRLATAAAATALDQDDHRGAAGTAPTAAPDLLSQDERIGGLLSTTTSPDEASKKVEGIRTQLTVNPKDYRLYYELGNALYDAGDQPAAISAYRKAIEINPKFVKAYVNLGETLRERGDLKESVSTLETALTLDDKSDVAHAALGFAYYTDRKYPDAMSQFKTALELNPKSVHATYYMGMAFADAQIYREAIKWWEKVCAIDPNSDACQEARENVNLLKRIVN